MLKRTSRDRWGAVSFIIAVIWLIAIPLMFIAVGFCLLPFALVISLVPIAALIYGVIAAIETNQDKNFKYWLIGDWVRGILLEKNN